MYTVFNRFKSPLTHYLVWDTWQKFVYVYEGMRKPFFKAQISVQNVIRDKWHHVDVRQPESEKPYSSGKSV